MSDLRIDAHGNVFLWEWPETGWSIARVTDLDWLTGLMDEMGFSPTGPGGIRLRPSERRHMAWFLLFTGSEPMSSTRFTRERGDLGVRRFAGGMEQRRDARGFGVSLSDRARAWIEFYVDWLGMTPWEELHAALLDDSGLEGVDSPESLESAMLDIQEARRQGRSPTGVPILDVDLFLLLDEPPPPLWPLDEFLEFVRQVARG